MKKNIYYLNKETGKIEGRFINCDTNSSRFRNTTVYDRFESIEDLPIGIDPPPDPPHPNTDKWKTATDQEKLDMIAEHLGWKEKNNPHPKDED